MAKPDHEVWVEILSYLRDNHSAVCRKWFEEIEPVRIEGGVFNVRLEHPIRRQYLERECSEHFTEALQAVTGRLMSVRFVEDEEPEAEAPSGPAVAASNGSMSGMRKAPASSSASPLAIVPDYTFENFIVGPENRLAHAAAKAVSSNPGKTYNPLFIHGGVGLGKTHLLQAICLALLNDFEDLSIYYVSCDEFMTQFMDAVQAGQMHDFRHRFRDVDVLVIDDIHFLAKRDRTQEEFFHTFNSLYQAEKQIILSSDAPPNEIPDLESRLVSRFQSGLVVQVNVPTYDTRVQIVKQKAKIRDITLEDDIACYIASRSATNIRELEGAITKVHMQSIADSKPLSLEIAKAALGSGDEEAIKPQVTISNIIETVTAFYGVKLTDLQSRRRQKSIALPRQVCMYLARRHTRFSLEEIGGYFGGRDHTTVMHAVKTIDRKRNEDYDFGRLVTSLEEQIEVASPGTIHAAAS